MSEEKTVFVSEETYKKIVEILGYAPPNLVITKFLPDDKQAIVVDNYNYGTYNYGNYNYGNYPSK